MLSSNKNNKVSGIIIALLLFLLAGAIFLLANFAFAQDLGKEYAQNVGLPEGDPRVLIVNILRIALGFLSIIAVAVIMYGGWLYMTSEGNEEKIGKAKNTLKNAVIGLVIILSAFVIVSFVLSWLRGGQFGRQAGGPSIPGPGYGFGAIGTCIVETVYPEPYQEKVPRNTSIIVTFKEEIDPATVCNLENDIDNDGKCNGEAVKTTGEGENLRHHIKIYKQSQENNCQLNETAGCDLIEVKVYSSDNRTFVFAPNDYLGSSSEFIWYVVYLNNDIRKKLDGAGAFDNCRTDYYRWQFKVDNKLDLTPPRITNVFPSSDNIQDEVFDSGAAVAASGSITVNSQPNFSADAEIASPVPGGDSGPAAVEGEYTCLQDGTISISISPGLTVSASGIAGLVNGDDASDGVASLGCGLELRPNDGVFKAGDSWTIAVTAQKQADTLTVGGITYTFGSDIQLGADVGSTAVNIASALAAHPDVNASASNNIVTLRAKVAGASGNDINLSSTNQGALAITAMSGGVNQRTGVIVKSREDQPRNSVIQINFNEAILPTVVMGNAQDVKDSLGIIWDDCPEGDSRCFDYNGHKYLNGRFEVSNIYKTVEFISNDECGVNNCGGKIYCLPGDANLRVELIAAELQDCGGDNCAAKSPYSNCVDGVCQDGRGINYPTADPKNGLKGIMDSSFNSLDGDRNGNAEGPVSFYNENELYGSCAGSDKICTNALPNNFTLKTLECEAGQGPCNGARDLQTLQDSQGDNYKWSFYVSDLLDLEPPTIAYIRQAQEGGGLQDLDMQPSGAHLSNPILINFSKLMMAGSLRSGSSFIKDEQASLRAGNDVIIEHKYMNLWNYTNSPLGYWIAKTDVDTNSDGEPDSTQAQFRHSMFGDSETFRAQIGSGVKDIHQNCYLPCSGPACTATTGEPSCCAGTLTGGSDQPICP